MTNHIKNYQDVVERYKGNYGFSSDLSKVYWLRAIGLHESGRILYLAWRG